MATATKKNKTTKKKTKRTTAKDMPGKGLAKKATKALSPEARKAREKKYGL